MKARIGQPAKKGGYFRLLLCVALVAGLVAVAPRAAKGQDLTSPPVLVSLSVGGDASPGSSVTLAWHLTSEAGVTSTSLWLFRPDNTPYSCFGTPSMVSGSPTDGVWAQSCFIWQNSITGTYSAVVQASDTAGNILQTDAPCDYSIYECDPLFPFSVVGGPDAGKPPVVVSFSADPSTVPAGSSVTFSWHVIGLGHLQCGHPGNRPGRQRGRVRWQLHRGRHTGSRHHLVHADQRGPRVDRRHYRLASQPRHKRRVHRHGCQLHHRVRL
jgi:hypothetical protein